MFNDETEVDATEAKSYVYVYFRSATEAMAEVMGEQDAPIGNNCQDL